MVGKERLELSRNFSHIDLNDARIPISPLAHLVLEEGFEPTKETAFETAAVYQFGYSTPARYSVFKDWCRGRDSNPQKRQFLKLLPCTVWLLHLGNFKRKKARLELFALTGLFDFLLRQSYPQLERSVSNNRPSSIPLFDLTLL